MLVHVTSCLVIGALPRFGHCSLFRVLNSCEDRGVKMANHDVEEWVLASTVTPGDEDDTKTDSWDKNRILARWAEGIQIIQTNLSSSSTKTRTEFLKKLVVPFVKDESEFFHPRGSRRPQALKPWKI